VVCCAALTVASPAMQLVFVAPVSDIGRRSSTYDGTDDGGASAEEDGLSLPRRSRDDGGLSGGVGTPSSRCAPAHESILGSVHLD
jgi:hypothetical protein